MDMQDFYKGKKILITGHTGFKGAWLSQILLNFGAEIVGISLPPVGEKNLFSILNIQNKITNYYVDIRNFEELKEIFKKEKPEIVFHLAAQAIVICGYKDPLETITSNVLGTANVLHAIKETEGIKSAVIITTDKVYENKDWVYGYRENDALGGYDPYSSSKAAADIITNSYIQSFFNPKDYKKKHVTLLAIARAGNVIGGGDYAPYRLVPDIIRSIYEKNEQILIRNPQAIRPWEHVMEPLSGYMMLARGLYEENIDYVGAWNFGPNSDSFVTVQKLTDEAVRIFKKGSVEYVVNEDVHETKILRLDTTKSKTVLGWEPQFDIQTNLEKTFSWYKQYYENSEKIEEFTNEQIRIFFNII